MMVREAIYPAKFNSNHQRGCTKHWLHQISSQGRQSVLKSEGDRLEDEEVRGYMLP